MVFRQVRFLPRVQTIKLESEEEVENLVNKLSKEKILDQKAGWLPIQKWTNQNLESKKQMIRDVRDIRSQASKARLNWMNQNEDKATKVYKSGAKEFGGEANRTALQQVTNDVINPYIQKLAADIRKERLKKAGTAAGIGVFAGIPIYQTLSNNIYDNVFPFGYYDSNKHDVTDPESIKALYKSVKKFIPAAYGFKSDARKDFDQITQLDLKDPKQRKRAVQIYKNNPYVHTPLGENTDIDYVQKIFRIRTDLNNLHAGRPQQFNSLIPNKEWQSIASKEDPNIITWVPRDKTIRNMYRSQGLAYNLLQDDIPKEKGYLSNGVSDNNGIYGGMSIVKTNNNGAGRYKDEWDFIGDDVLQPLGFSKRVVLGDTIPTGIKTQPNFGKESSVRK